MAMSPSDPRAIQAATVKALDGTGGGNPPPNVNPDLLVTGGSWGGANKIADGQYEDPSPVPIGAIVTVTTQNLPGGYNILSILWGGGTDYKSYFNQDGGSPPNVPQKVVTGVPINNSSYTFIADILARTYTITCQITYLVGEDHPTGSSSIKFTTVSPTTRMSLLSQGKTTYYPPGSPEVDPNGVGIQYDNNANEPNQPENSGVRFSATTSTSLGGSFMFLQMVQPNITAVIKINGVNQNKNWIGKTAGTAIDTFAKSNTVGYVTDSSSNSPGVYQWKMKPADPAQTNAMSDTPFANWSDNTAVQSLEVGTPGVPNATPPTPPSPMTFQTYLMYRGEGGVWVAVAEKTWSWSGGIVRDFNFLELDVNNPLASPAPTTVSPPSIGPTWVDQGLNYHWDPP